MEQNTMVDVAAVGPAVEGRDTARRIALMRLLRYLPRGNTLDDRAWRRRHRLLQGVLLLHLPLLAGLGLYLGRSVAEIAFAIVAPVACLIAGRLVHHRRLASF